MTAKEYWKMRFGEYPKNDADKLAVAMMQEYRKYFDESEQASEESQDENINDIILICSMNKKDIAYKLIKEQFIISERRK